MQYLEALTVCVGYHDFLSEIIPYNRVHFDRWLIITSLKDEQTKELCRKHNLEFLATDDFYRDGNVFNKGAGIDRGLAILSHRDWVLHIDGDMCLPGDFRESMEDADLNPDCIHGVDRFMLKSWEDWQKLKRSGWLQRDYHCRVNSHPEFPIGTRWADIRHGYVPLGAFQLYHTSADMWRGIRTRRYPDWHADSTRSDIAFGLMWDRRRRILIPETVAAHLESEPSKKGVNWQGRVSKPFGPPQGKPETNATKSG